VIFILIILTIPIFLYGAYKRYILAKKLNLKLNPIRIIFSILGTFFLFIAALDIKKEGDIISKRKIPIYFLLDISRSMLVEDIKPNRLEVMKKIVLDIIQGLDRDICIIVFAGEAYTFLPLTRDLELANNFLSSIDSSYVAPGETNILKALSLANKNAEKKIKVIFTDGEDNSKNSIEVDNQNLFVAMGTKNGGPIPFEGLFLKDSKGSNVISRMNFNYLNSIGKTYTLVGLGRDIKNLKNDIAKITDYTERKIVKYVRYYQIFLFLAIIFYLSAYFSKPIIFNKK
jgi:Ca-activated chloride channel family protein